MFNSTCFPSLSSQIPFKSPVFILAFLLPFCLASSERYSRDWINLFFSLIKLVFTSESSTSLLPLSISLLISLCIYFLLLNMKQIFGIHFHFFLIGIFHALVFIYICLPPLPEMENGVYSVLLVCLLVFFCRAAAKIIASFLFNLVNNYHYHHHHRCSTGQPKTY